MKRQVSYSFCRTSGQGGDAFHLSITDVASSQRILDVNMSPADAAFFMTGRWLDLHTEVSDNLDLVGMRQIREHREVPVEKLPIDRDKAEAALRKACRPLETDGWQADIGRYFSSQKAWGENGVVVMFTKYIPDTEGASQ